MSRFAPRHRSDTTERPIIDALEAAGAYVLRLDGTLDLAVAYRGKWLMLDAKSKRTPITANQRDAVAKARQRGCEIFFPRTPQEAVLCVTGRPPASCLLPRDTADTAYRP